MDLGTIDHWFRLDTCVKSVCLWVLKWNFCEIHGTEERQDCGDVWVTEVLQQTDAWEKERERNKGAPGVYALREDELAEKRGKEGRGQSWGGCQPYQGKFFQEGECIGCHRELGKASQCRWISG